MYSFVMLRSIDPSLGRVDFSSLPDQTFMEMLIDGFDDETKRLYQDSEGMYLDVCEWSCVKCDEFQSVVSIRDNKAVSGSFQLRYIPPTVKDFQISQKKLTGSIDLAQLPESIEFLYLQQNQLEGSVDLTQLPERMKRLYLNRNQFQSSIVLTQLPEGMEGSTSRPISFRDQLIRETCRGNSRYSPSGVLRNFLSFTSKWTTEGPVYPQWPKSTPSGSVNLLFCEFLRIINIFKQRP